MKLQLIPVGLALVALAGAPMSASAGLAPGSFGGPTRTVTERDSLPALSSEALGDIRPGGVTSTPPMLAKRSGSSQSGGKRAGKSSSGQSNAKEPGRSDSPDSRPNRGTFKNLMAPNTPRTLHESPAKPTYTPRTTR